MSSLRQFIIDLAKRIYMKFYTNPLIARLIINQFHRLYYQTPVPVRTWHKTYWLGAQVLKCPLDLWNYQEIIYEAKPDIIIESGTGNGGSALFFASICDLIGKGRVVTVDITDKKNRPKHGRIEYFMGSSTAPETIARLEKIIQECNHVMVVLDSDHSMQHVLKELQEYSRFVTLGSYLIVEDTCINGHPVAPQFGPGPMEAVQIFLRETDNFVVDKRREKFLLTFNPNGYLKRVK
jgi:cephalosporin hydroxylase